MDDGEGGMCMCLPPMPGVYRMDNFFWGSRRWIQTVVLAACTVSAFACWAIPRLWDKHENWSKGLSSPCMRSVCFNEGSYMWIMRFGVQEDIKMYKKLNLDFKRMTQWPWNVWRCTSRIWGENRIIKSQRPVSEELVWSRPTSRTEADHWEWGTNRPFGRVWEQMMDRGFCRLHAEAGIDPQAFGLFFGPTLKVAFHKECLQRKQTRLPTRAILN